MMFNTIFRWIFQLILINSIFRSSTRWSTKAKGVSTHPQKCDLVCKSYFPKGLPILLGLSLCILQLKSYNKCIKHWFILAFYCYYTDGGKDAYWLLAKPENHSKFRFFITFLLFSWYLIDSTFMFKWYSYFFTNLQNLSVFYSALKSSFGNTFFQKILKNLCLMFLLSMNTYLLIYLLIHTDNRKLNVTSCYSSKSQAENILGTNGIFNFIFWRILPLSFDANVFMYLL